MKTEYWRIALGIVLVLALPMLVALGLLLALLYLNPELDVVIGALLMGHTPVGVVLQLGLIAASLPVLALVMRLLHKSRLAVLFGRWRPRWFVIATLVLLAIQGVLYLSDPHDLVFSALPLGQWLLWLAPALLIILLQCAAEELVFRGYLQSMLLARMRIVWLALLIPSVIFALGHYNPVSFGPNAWLAVGVTGLWALMMAHITWQSGSLLPAIGLHFANNVIAILILTTDGPMSGLALYFTLTDLRDPVIGANELWMTAAYELGLYALYQLIRYLYLRRARAILQSNTPPSI